MKNIVALTLSICFLGTMIQPSLVTNLVLDEQAIKDLKSTLIAFVQTKVAETGNQRLVNEVIEAKVEVSLSYHFNPKFYTARLTFTDRSLNRMVSPAEFLLERYLGSKPWAKPWYILNDHEVAAVIDGKTSCCC
ncbi:MAG TPA: hypothetical protein VLG50_08545 [Candidatus Saccharimonadales bacterium]|nr:hypothetical protein [Candidatus Saccharimonadales bacterium]